MADLPSTTDLKFSLKAFTDECSANELATTSLKLQYSGCHKLCHCYFKLTKKPSDKGHTLIPILSSIVLSKINSPGGELTFSLVSWPSLASAVLWCLPPTMAQVFSYYLFFTQTDYLQGGILDTLLIMQHIFFYSPYQFQWAIT